MDQSTIAWIRRRDEQIEVGLQRIRSIYPQVSLTDARKIAENVLDAGDGVADPYGAWLEDIARAALTYYDSVGRNGETHSESRIAIRNLEKVVFAHEKVESYRVFDSAGKEVGTLSRGEAERLVGR